MSRSRRWTRRCSSGIWAFHLDFRSQGQGTILPHQQYTPDQRGVELVPLRPHMLRPGTFRFNPLGQAFEAVAHMYRFQGPPLGARDRVDVPNKWPKIARETGEMSIGIRRRSAVQHMALVYPRPMAADLDFQTEELHRHFWDLFGADEVVEVEDEIVRNIAEEGDESSDEDEKEDTHADDDVF